jgi:hypothetical protein
VTLPAVAGFTIDPSAGAHPVSSGSDFTFSLTPTASLPDGMRLQVSTNRLLLPDAAGLQIWPNLDSYTVTIYRVQENTKVSIAIASGVDAILPAQVWAFGSTLYIHATQSGTAQVYRLTGQLATTLILVAGETAQTTLPAGMYLVVVNGRASKVVIGN